MSEFLVHFDLYKKFKNDAENKSLFNGTRVEIYFLSAYHLIESCAAKERIHINKHQNIRAVLEENEFLFGENTVVVWRSFQIIENQLRPKFTYSISGTKADLNKIIENFKIIEKISMEKIGNVWKYSCRNKKRTGE